MIFLFDQSLFTSPQRCSFGSINISASAVYNSPILRISINGSGFEPSPSGSAVVCAVKGLVLPLKQVAGRNDVVISTFGFNAVGFTNAFRRSLCHQFLQLRQAHLDFLFFFNERCEQRSNDIDVCFSECCSKRYPKGLHQDDICYRHIF